MQDEGALNAHDCIASHCGAVLWEGALGKSPLVNFVNTDCLDVDTLDIIQSFLNKFLWGCKLCNEGP